jgi:uncharacterized Zn-binding protein involved in type VI secretion
MKRTLSARSMRLRFGNIGCLSENLFAIRLNSFCFLLCRLLRRVCVCVCVVVVIVVVVVARYEVTFSDEALGFRVRPAAGQGMAVSLVISPALAGVVSVGDVVVAVNGAPLGRVTDPAALANKLSLLRRPVKITFARFDTSTGDGAASDQAAENDAFSPAELSTARIAQVFAQYGRAGSGDLDTFELAHAVEALTGRAPPSAEVAALVQASGAVANKNVLTLAQFTFLVRSFDWARSARSHKSVASERAAAASGLGLRQYEHAFASKSLGFRVQRSSGASQGRLVVSALTAPALAGRVALGDALLAVNGAPMGFVTDPKVCV